MRTIGAGYFSTGVFAHALPGEFFASYSCLECGHRAKTWAAFREHRRPGVCAGASAIHLGHTSVPAPTEEELDRLAVLDEQLRGEYPEALAAHLAVGEGA